MNDEILNKTVEILNKTVNETLGSMSTSACIYNNTDYCEGIIPLALAWETSAVIIGIAALGCLTQKYGPQVSDCLCGSSQDSVFWHAGLKVRILMLKLYLKLGDHLKYILME